MIWSELNPISASIYFERATINAINVVIQGYRYMGAFFWQKICVPKSQIMD
ncbi:hypothetical protein MXB_1299 [Myxobolus squamalis]|nr:hypothetical protein MXB_1299 [Myxobolus squamalis]